MKYLFAGLLVLMISLQGNAQFYYSDVLATRQTNTLYTQLRSLGIKKITGVSYEGSEPSKDFLLEQELSSDGSMINTHSASMGNTESFFTGFYNGDKVRKTSDSSSSAISSVEYLYDDQGRVSTINLNSRDFDGTFITTETHQWKYGAKGLPESMLKIKNGVDTTRVLFVIDDQDNVAEESWFKKNVKVETYYYYYNSNRQLTDIVRFNRKAKAMLPDFIFEYDANGKLSQMTQLQAGLANYLIWRYSYNARGLKEREIAFNKQKQLVGRVEYTYQ